jgi:hypothetical protein
MMTDIAQHSGPVEARDAAHLEVEDVLKRAREALARSREILGSSRGEAGFDAALPPADDRADAA